MKSIISFFLRFTCKEYTPLQRAVAMIPGILIFLVLSPLCIILFSRYLSSFISLHLPRLLELVIMTGALLISVTLMTWGLVELWHKGKGSPAPIAPTTSLVTTGPYSWCRNPIELGTNIYFLALGIYFDGFLTGLFSLLFGLILGIAYIKVIEEKEMQLRFGQAYEEYLHSVPFMAVPFIKRRVVQK